MSSSSPARLELWGGVECSVSRVGDRWDDQLERSGHARRPEDLDLIAELGVAALRFPVLWERTVRLADEWERCDGALERLRRLGIRPIVGLLHHGSGPPGTDLLDPKFPEKFAEHARRAAERWPWVLDWSPVNEPLTTARFSALYGLWYPHRKDPLSFGRALLNQCRAIVLAMREIRRAIPGARLVQPEDLGKTYATRPLAYQARFENERRWLTFDLLEGRVDTRHPIGKYLLWAGVPPAEIAYFRENPCPPDVLGINHYLTSERLLDHRVTRYPEHVRGGNGRDAYADVEAVRAVAEGIAGPGALVREAWRRYRRPIALTEVHLGCTREEQLRWFHEVWQSAQRLAGSGVDVRAVTCWALLGSYDWHRLLTSPEGRYEPGAFDLLGPKPRQTALAQLLRALAKAPAERAPHPVLASPGWWRRPGRLEYVPVSCRRSRMVALASRRRTHAPPILVTGGRGTLARAFSKICQERGLEHRLLAREELDVADPASVRAAFARHRPWAVVNAAGYVRVDDAEDDAVSCLRQNAQGAAVLAGTCAAHGARLVTFSSDLVFDGAKGAPYVESDVPSPLGNYGRSKAEAEQRALELLPGALVVRTSAFFGPWDEANFLTRSLAALARGERVAAAEDWTVSPTYVPDLVHASLDLLVDGETGVWHLANAGAVSWAGLARLAARSAGLDDALVDSVPGWTLDLPAPRPRFSALASERGSAMPGFEDAVARYVSACYQLRRTAAGSKRTSV